MANSAYNYRRMNNWRGPTYADLAKEYDGHSSRWSGKIANNTYLQRHHGDTMVVRLYATNVVTLRRLQTGAGDNDWIDLYTLAAGGHHTPTTTGRIACFAPVHAAPWSKFEDGQSYARDSAGCVWPVGIIDRDTPRDVMLAAALLARPSDEGDSTDER